MGRPMVDRLVATGHEVCVLGRSPAARKTLAAAGIRAADDIGAVADDSDVVVVCVFTDDQVNQVCLDTELVSRMPKGSALVVHTTGSPRTAEAVAARAAEYGVGALDAPVSGGPHDIAAGMVTLFVGGDDGTLERARPVLSSYGDPVVHAGPVGAGQRVKLVNNTLFAAQIGLLAEAVALGERLGIKESALLAALPHGSGASRALGGISMRGSVAGFVDTVGEFVGKDVAVIRKVTADLGSDLGLLDTVISAGFAP